MTSPYRFRTAHPATVGFGPAQEVRLRDSGDVVGFVRRVLVPSSPGMNWVLYSPAGDQVGISDQRATGANFLGREYAKAGAA